MHDIPEEAKNAVAKALRESRWLVPAPAVELILTAARPFLSGQAAVKKLEWELVSGDHYAEGSGTHYNIYETKPGLWNSVTVKPGNVRLATNVSLEDAKAAAQADYEARILSALEPSSAREQALTDLEEIQRAVFGTLGSEPDVYADYDRLCELSRKMREAIRALSSPDHADARKFRIGDQVTKTKGSSWTGRVVGFYSTKLTPIGYAVESETEIGSVQIYPEAALTSAPADAGKVEGDGSAAAHDVLAERRRQIEAEGWTEEHDDSHSKGEMLTAAWCYMQRHADKDMFGDNYDINKLPPPARWPWSKKWWKPSKRRRDLVKAGALILAEIERLDRLATHPSGGDRHGE